MIEIKIAVIILCAACKLVGELWWHNSQRYIMPVIICIGISIVTGIWWLGFCVLPMIAPLVLGYKDYGPSNGFDRGAWLFAICFVAGLPLAILHHLSWIMFIPWCIIAGAWGGLTRNLWNVIIAPISGALIGLIIFLVH